MSSDLTLMQSVAISVSVKLHVSLSSQLTCHRFYYYYYYAVFNAPYVCQSMTKSQAWGVMATAGWARFHNRESLWIIAAGSLSSHLLYFKSASYITEQICCIFSEIYRF